MECFSSSSRLGYQPLPVKRVARVSTRLTANTAQKQVLNWRLRVSAYGQNSDRAGGVSVAVKDVENAEVQGTSTAERGDSSSGSSADSRTSQKKRDKEALMALNTYFDKLKATQPKKDSEDGGVKGETAVAATLAAEALTSTVAAPPAAEAAAAEPTSKKADDSASADESLKALAEKLERKEPLKQEDVEEMVKRILETVKEQKEKGDDKASSSSSSPQLLVAPLYDSPYDEWLAEQSLQSPPSAVYGVIAVNVAVFLFELASPEALPGVLSTSLPALLGAKVNALINAGEWWRLLTPSFLHAGFLHLGVTTFFLAGMGAIVELMFGAGPFLALYLASAVAGNVASFAVTPEVAVGASGPLYGIAAAYSAAVWKNREAIGEEEADNTVRGIVLVALLFQVFGTGGVIDGWTHIGSLLAGLSFGLLASPTIKRVPNPSTSPSSDSPSPPPLLPGLSPPSPAPFKLEAQPAEAQRVALALAVCAGLTLGLLQLPLLNEVLQGRGLVEGLGGDDYFY